MISRRICLTLIVNARRSIRFAPPLVIEEEDLLKAIKLIEESLIEIDTLDRIPFDDSEEKNTVIGLED